MLNAYRIVANPSMSVPGAFPFYWMWDGCYDRTKSRDGAEIWKVGPTAARHNAALCEGEYIYLYPTNDDNRWSIRCDPSAYGFIRYVPVTIPPCSSWWSSVWEYKSGGEAYRILIIRLNDSTFIRVFHDGSISQHKTWESLWKYCDPETQPVCTQHGAQVNIKW